MRWKCNGSRTGDSKPSSSNIRNSKKTTAALVLVMYLILKPRNPKMLSFQHVINVKSWWAILHSCYHAKSQSSKPGVCFTCIAATFHMPSGHRRGQPRSSSHQLSLLPSLRASPWGGRTWSPGGTCLDSNPALGGNLSLPFLKLPEPPLLWQNMFRGPHWASQVFLPLAGKVQFEKKRKKQWQTNV